MTDLAPAAAETARIVAGVRDDQLTGPTPCTGTSVAAMLDHLLGLTTAFRMAAEKVRPDGGPSADAANLPDDWRVRLPEQLDALATAWRAPGAWEGMTEAGGVEMPAGVRSPPVLRWESVTPAPLTALDTYSYQIRNLNK